MFDLMDSSTSLVGVVTAVVAWCSLYLATGFLWPSRCAEWHCRQVTLVHGSTITLISGWCSFVEGPNPFLDPGGPNTPLQQFICIVCLGYFIFDLAWCLYHQTEGLFMLTHHALSVTGLATVIFTGVSGTELVGSIFGTEAANPFLQLRWFLRKSNLHRTWYYELNDALFMLLFTFFRIGLASYLLFIHFFHPRPGWIFKFGGFVIYTIGWVFWIMILKYAAKKYSTKDKGQLNGKSHSE